MKKSLLLIIVALLSLGSTTYAQDNVEEKVSFIFIAGKDMFYSPYEGNDASLEKLSQFIKENFDAIVVDKTPIYVDGYCATSGTVQERMSRAKIMSNRVKSHMIVFDKMKEEYFVTKNHPESFNNHNNVVVVTIDVKSKEIEEVKVVEEAPKVEEKEEVVEATSVVPAAVAQPATDVDDSDSCSDKCCGSKKPRNRWDLGVNVGMPFVWGDMITTSAAKIYTGFSAGLQATYRISRLFGVTLAADYFETKAGARQYAKGYSLSENGLTYYFDEGVATEKYYNLYSDIAGANASLSVDINLNRVFSDDCENHRLTAWLSPTIYGQYFDSQIRYKSNDQVYTNGTTAPEPYSIGYGGSMSIRYRICDHGTIQFKNSMIKVTDRHFDSITTFAGGSRRKAMWLPQIGFIWNL